MSPGTGEEATACEERLAKHPQAKRTSYSQASYGTASL